MDLLIALTDPIALAVFAISGALAAAEQKLDITGFVLFGVVTGVGGGTARDLLLGADIFWIAQPRYLWVAIGASVATWFIAPYLKSLLRQLLWADAVGLALFSVLGTAKSLEWGVAPVVAVVLGMMTATFGSLIRDTLLNRSAVLLGPEIYVTAAGLGAVSYVTLVWLGVPVATATAAAMAVAFLLRAGAILFGLSWPGYKSQEDVD